MNTYICLENIRSTFNVGSIMRTCSFFGIKNIILLGYSGKTRNKQNQTILHPKIAKVSLGSEADLNLLFMETSTELINFARDQHLKLVCVEQAPLSMSLGMWLPTNNCIVIFGNEVTGVSSQLLSAATEIVEIPKTGTHNSLNVEVTAGIIINKLSQTTKL